MPVWTNAQQGLFFTSENQMGLTNDQIIALSTEGLSQVSDFADFKQEELKIAIKNVRTGIPTIPGTSAIPAAVDTDGVVTQTAVAAVPPVPGIRPLSETEPSQPKPEPQPLHLFKPPHQISTMLQPQILQLLLIPSFALKISTTIPTLINQHTSVIYHLHLRTTALPLHFATRRTNKTSHL